MFAVPERGGQTGGDFKKTGMKGRAFQARLMKKSGLFHAKSSNASGSPPAAEANPKMV